MVFDILVGILLFTGLFIVSYLLYVRYKEDEWKRNNPDDPWSQ